MRFVVILLLLLSIPTSAEKLKLSPDWIPVIGYKHSTTKLFYDHRSLSRTSTNIGILSLLMTSTVPLKLVIDNTPIVTRSIVKHVVMDCDTGLMAPASDYYYSVAMPSVKDKPFAIYTYTNMAGTETVKKSSLMYGLVCPTPI